jgi:hypothetical protein
VDRVLASPSGGTPIPPEVRRRVEPHVGTDLGAVRVLTGPRAAVAAASLGARAFTAGSTIVLGRRESPHDTRLLAHEAAHVVQQEGAADRAAVHRATIMRDLTDLLPDLPDVSVTDLVPQWILDGVTEAVRSIPGYRLLTQVIGTDPLTGAPVESDRQGMIDELLSYGPFGAAVGQALQGMDALGDVVAVVTDTLGQYRLTFARLESDVDAAWDQFSVTNGIDGNVAIVARVIEGILADVRRFVTDLAGRVLAIVREAVLDLVEPLLTQDPTIGPVWTLATKVFHHDPLRGVPVEAETVDILADFLHLIGQDAALDQMRERGTLQETADWLDTQFETFLGLLDQATTLFSDAWAAIQPENLGTLPETLPGLAQREFALVVGVGAFAGTVLVKVVELVKHSLLGMLSDYAYAIPGFRLLSVIIGRNPFTGEEVPRTAENLIGGFITLLPGGEATYQQLSETGVIGEAAARIESAMATLGITPELVTGTFLGLWDTLSLADLQAPVDTFQRVVEQFGEPIARIVEFVTVVVQVVIELVLRLMNFPSDLLASIITQTVQAIDDIQRDPVGFLLRMVEALKAGFQGFLDNSLDYLMQGLVSWLFRGLAQLGITIPTEISFASILGLVLEVLGLTVDFVWRKLGEHLGEDEVEMVRENLGKLGGAWAFIQDVQSGDIAAIWQYVADQLSTLWSTILSMAAEWAMTRIIVNGTIKLLTFLDPTFIMSVVNGCIAFFEAVRSAIEYVREILEIVDMYVSTIASIAKGDIGPGAQMVEQGLAAAVPVALGFLAAQLGLGNIPDKIAEIIRSIREVVEAAIDWLIEQAMKLGAAALNALTHAGGVAQSATVAAASTDGRLDEAAPPRVDPRVRELAITDLDKVFQDGISSEQVRPALNEVMDARRAQGLSLLQASQTPERPGYMDLYLAASPKEFIRSVRVNPTDRKARELVENGQPYPEPVFGMSDLLISGKIDFPDAGMQGFTQQTFAIATLHFSSRALSFEKVGSESGDHAEALIVDDIMANWEQYWGDLDTETPAEEPHAVLHLKTTRTPCFGCTARLRLLRRKAARCGIRLEIEVDSMALHQGKAALSKGARIKAQGKQKLVESGPAIGNLGVEALKKSGIKVRVLDFSDPSIQHLASQMSDQDWTALRKKIVGWNLRLTQALYGLSPPDVTVKS